MANFFVCRQTKNGLQRENIEARFVGIETLDGEYHLSLVNGTIRLSAANGNLLVRPEANNSVTLFTN